MAIIENPDGTDTVYLKIRKVRVIPKSKRAKNRVHEHGDIFWLGTEGTFDGLKAILVRSDDGWHGWLDCNECDWDLDI